MSTAELFAKHGAAAAPIEQGSTPLFQWFHKRYLFLKGACYVAAG